MSTPPIRVDFVSVSLAPLDEEGTISVEAVNRNGDLLPGHQHRITLVEAPAIRCESEPMVCEVYSVDSESF